MSNNMRREQEYRELGYDVQAFDRHISAVSSRRERDYLCSLQAGFLDGSAHPSAPYVPKMLYNNKDASENVLSTLEVEFQKCQRFDIAVAFVTKGGVTVLMNTLLDLENRAIPGRVLVSTYLGFNDPDALDRLRAFRNIELRIYEGSLHSKGYLFSSDGICALVVGSSNLTQGALLANSEWNLLVKAYERGAIADATRREFGRLWESVHTREVTQEWLTSYRVSWKRNAPQRTFRTRESAEIIAPSATTTARVRIEPNKMQVEALRNLKRLRDAGASRALLVSATGTGKTFPIPPSARIVS